MVMKIVFWGLVKPLLFLSERHEEARKGDLDHETQKRLIQEFKTDPDVFEEVYNHYYEMIFRYLLKRVMSSEVAYDLTADTFMKAFQNFGRYKWKGFSMKVWLFRIAINSLKNHRRGKRFVAPLDDVPEGHENMAIDARDELKLLDKSLFGDERLGQLSDAIDTLNPKYKQVLSLYYFSEMSQREIAEVTQKSESAVKAMMHRAITNLRQLLDPNTI